MNLGFLGRGRLAGVCMEEAVRSGHAVHRVWDEVHPLEDNLEGLGLDLVLEMSLPALVLPHAKMVLKAGLPLVVGTTGWYAQMDDLRNCCEKYNGSVLWASNFAPGVQIFRQLAVHMTRMINALPDYTLRMEEVHHLHKVDRPSGTAVHTAAEVVKASKRYLSWVSDTEPKENELLVSSYREEGEVGTHRLIAELPFEAWTLEHRALDRKAFGWGAIRAAEWLSGRKGFFGIDAFYEDLWSASEKGGVG